MKILKNIQEVEKALGKVLHTELKPEIREWCWITRDGRLLPCAFEGHNYALGILFTDKLNPEMAPFVVDFKDCYLNYENFIEQYWVKVSTNMIFFPKTKTTNKQLRALDALIMAKKEYFFEGAKKLKDVCDQYIRNPIIDIELIQDNIYFKYWDD